MFDVKDTKKIIEKIKKVCSAIIKYNLNSPCLLQFVMINGNIEVVLSHNPSNGNTFNFYKIFNVVTYDNFEISEEDRSFFETGDERVSTPIIVSSFPIAEYNETTKLNPLPYYADKKYTYSLDSFYIFPKFMLEAIKSDYITGFEFALRDSVSKQNTMNFYIKTTENERFRNILLIPNQERLEYLFRLSVFPLHRPSFMNDLFMKLYLQTAATRLVLDPKEWTKEFERHKSVNAMNMQGYNNEPIIIYHNDYLQAKLSYGHIAKFYESLEGRNSNIVTLYFGVGISGNTHLYFKYRYYENNLANSVYYN